MSAPRPMGLPPAAMIAASPPVEPPAMRRVSQGLRVRPYTLLADSSHSPHSETLVVPSTMAPAARSRATWGASSSATMSLRATTPAVQGSPSTAISSLMVHGTPKKGGRGSGSSVSASTRSHSAAWARAASKVSTTTALMAGLTCAMWTSTASATETSRARMRRAISVAGRLQSSCMPGP